LFRSLLRRYSVTTQRFAEINRRAAFLQNCSNSQWRENEISSDHFKSDHIWQFFNAKKKQKGFMSQPKDRYSSWSQVKQISYNLNTYLMCNDMSNLDYLIFGYTLLSQILTFLSTTNKEQTQSYKTIFPLLLF
jgi:hypothetical protein